MRHLVLLALMWITAHAQTYPTQPVTAAKAMVVTDHPEATQVGVDILKQGGNAVDAAIAVQFALAVVLPEAGNIGGGGFLLYRASDGTLAALDYREVAPAAAEEKMYLDAAGNVKEDASTLGHLACGVPGTVDGMWRMHQKYGKLPWKDLVQPAYMLAGRGYLITDLQARRMNAFRDIFIQYNSKPVDFVRKDPWKAGDRLRQYTLTLTLERIRDKGRDGFYTGPTADLLVEEMQRVNGLITHDDLARYESKWRTPYTFDHMGHRLVCMPPPSSGGIVLQQILGMVAEQDLAKMGHNSDAYIHLMAEAERRAYADRAHYIADPAYVPVPDKQLTDPAYLRQRMSNYDPKAATPSTELGAGTLAEPDHTTHYSIVDEQGNAISVTTTLNGLYGSGLVVGDAGFLLNNEMDDFSAKPYSPNSFDLVYGTANKIEPGKRPLSSMTPTIVLKDNKPVLVIGAAGGPTIITAVLQLYLNVTVFGMNMQQAVSAPRFHHQWMPDQLRIEASRMKGGAIKKLEKRGHMLQPVDHISLANGIRLLPNGTLEGGAEPRSDAKALGY